MKTNTITYEDVLKLYNEFRQTSQHSETTILEHSYEQITNRNFGIKDYTISTNFSEYRDQYSKCSIDN